jgi:hypothetical protein
MFFGTTTTTGLKVGFTANVPDSFHFGFKRKEFSLIPLGKDGDKEVYPSVMASLDTTGQGGANQTAGLQSSQFFATGAAADSYAKDPTIQALFKNAAADAFREYSEAVVEQEKEAMRILRCYAGVKVTDLSEVWNDAEAQGLFKDKDNLGKVLEWYKSAIAPGADPSVRDNNLRMAHRRYAGDIADLEGSKPLRIVGLAKHREKVCEIAKR